MQLLFKQRLFSWLCSYDIYNTAGEAVYTVKGQLAWGHCLKIFDRRGQELGTVKQKILTLLPTFELYLAHRYIGSIRREFSLFVPRYQIDCKGWTVEGNLFEWDYSIYNRSGAAVATVSKQLFNWTDTYVLDIQDPADALYVLMLVIAIDAEKCSRDN